MSIRLLKDLEARAHDAKSNDELLLLRAERTCALARLGRIPPARKEIAELRRLNTKYLPTLSGWILLAEGMIEHFESLDPHAKDRFSRAYAIAVAAGESRLRGIAAAWMAICEYRMGNISQAIARSNEAIQHSSSEHCHAALSRAQLVLADCYSLSGQLDEAHRRYAVARKHAVEEGDIAMQSAILFNSAAYSVAHWDLAHAFNEPFTGDSRRVELEVLSVTNLDLGVGNQALKSSTGLLNAQLRLCQERWADAFALYDEFIDLGRSEGLGRWVARHLAEQAYCAVSLGKTDAASKCVADSLAEIDSTSDSDDLAVTYARLAGVMHVVADPTRAKQFDELARSMRSTFTRQQEEVQRLLQSLQHEH